MAFKNDITVRLSRTDSGRVLYFAEYLSLCHETYEAYLDSVGFSVARIIDEGEFAMPIVHAETDLKAPAFVSDVLRFELTLALGKTSLKGQFNIFKGDETIGSAQLVSVCINAQTRAPMPLPNNFRKAIESGEAAR